MRKNQSKETVRKKTHKLKPPFGYFGSKHRLAVKLCSNLPPHNAWVEAFCGSSALTLAKTPAPIEVINDIDDEIINLFKQLRERPKQVCKLIALTPYARQELNEARTKRKKISGLESARRFLVSAMMAINGIFGEAQGGFSYSLSYTRNNREARVNRWYNLPNRISEIVERLRGVRIEKMDARKLLAEYLDRPATLVYLDPPYLADRTNGYNNDANDEGFHKELLKLANKAKCMIFISGYDNKLYRNMLSKKNGWSKKQIKTTTRDSSGQSHVRVEVVWMNKHFVKAQKTSQVPIKLSKQEKKMHKLNPSR